MGRGKERGDGVRGVREIKWWNGERGLYASMAKEGALVFIRNMLESDEGARGAWGVRGIGEGEEGMCGREG